MSRRAIVSPPWLDRLLVAHEALDLGDRPACARALKEAGAAFEENPRLAEGYCAGKWSDWYRGCRKLNISATMKKTREVAELAEQAAERK